ncbi:MAG: hypothetical protein A2008_09790 [Candidatus Wallbacteria bacterium GWC2_49_35]|uniref:NFACT protein RNA binding domain-containing protein n=1 Tax=Candidatus Wallbacteria bacterium GWC2_49_35 TaxID=1817813 RepID=A0A1F7WFW6_9BACT|nr:MAG: hypothetical protein A2008_09790 [Candidatus Wallbacteria bacterium GWC2_49_35]HBC75976.1 hypothetical protein [Candidatus Wallbacteria bacterium]
MEKIKAVALMSGGLDSMLAAKVMEKIGIEVMGINFYTGFCITEQRRRVDGSKSAASKKKLENAALKSAAEIEIPVEIVDISKQYLEMVTKPKHGYGSNVNPCIDCRIHMLREAHKYMQKIGAKFIVTGEVVGQRPMSQHKNTMRMIEKEAGVAGLVLRPLSAKLLEPTLPETSGWVNRDELYDIGGRGRNPQMRLARELGIEVFPNPGGGCCFLTDQTYAERFFDLMRHRVEKTLTMEDVVRLRLGRHFRIKESHKIIIGRNEAENDLIEKYSDEKMAIVKATVEKGPVSLIEGEFGEDDIRLAASLTAGYGKAKALAEVEFDVTSGGKTRSISVKPVDPQAYSEYLIQHRP